MKSLWQRAKRLSWAIEMPARAKINWNLDITGQREDGYHLLDSLMQPLALCDYLYIKKDDQLTLEIGGAKQLAADDSNLVMKAARALQQYAGITQGAKMYLEKNIPMGAGLGGGSADAAAALRGLCNLWDLEIEEEELMTIGLSLGADVPFCLLDEPARAQGIGEILTPIPCKKTFPLILIQPCAALTTKEVFTAWHQGEALSSDMGKCMQALAEGNLSLLSAHAKNGLEQVSIPMRPEIDTARQALLNHGAVMARMTGSGSVVFGAFTDEKAARQAHKALLNQYKTCILTETAL
ncbi:MAG: 4-(cytidine 5'-diphospho)-2-C-methyl-D-erythritol kinase [Clostridia bacterium]|nr:4-(cytidine 5'-diphospho)-2-C-methyl-D-erythritol kinase [Clostridia bacterium]